MYGWMDVWIYIYIYIYIGGPEWVPSATAKYLIIAPQHTSEAGASTRSRGAFEKSRTTSGQQTPDSEALRARHNIKPWRATKHNVRLRICTHT